MLNIIKDSDSYNLIEYNKTNTSFLNIKIAAFDLDNTLIITSSGRTFAENVHDWKFKYDNVISTLTNFLNRNYKIVIITNQLGVSMGKTVKEDLYKKILYISKAINIDLTWIVSFQDDLYRKPRIKSLDLLDIVDKNSSFYCGDACGRKNDFSDTDCKFAHNAGIKFYSDKYIFTGVDDIHEYKMGIHPTKYMPPYIDISPMIYNKTSEREVILMIGPIASGKSTLCKIYFHDYKIINQDELKSLAKCKKEVLNILVNTELNIIIDATNRNIKTRKAWLDLLEPFNINIRYIFINIPKELSLHINTYRTLMENKKIPKVAIHTFYKQLDLPTKDESPNIKEILSIPFYLNESLVNIDLFKMYLN